ncbi:MAG TPA: hypothetical protein VHU62_17805 [Mycobacterium sp.]|jgi:hypothetical protein|nr:hypothetical protein [Mycobacterium sp.]
MFGRTSVAEALGRLGLQACACATVALLTVLLVTGCGGSRNATTTAEATAGVPAYLTHGTDRDNDGDRNDDDLGTIDFGHAADAADLRESTALLTRYFAAAATGDGHTGCALLLPFVAEALPEQDAPTPQLRHSSCAVVLSRLFAMRHALLAVKHTSLRVAAVRVQGDRALAVLDFPAIPEVRQMTERRVGGRWRLLSIFDGILE